MGKRDGHKVNCWEFMKCGRELNGSRIAELGQCQAAIDSSSDGMSCGKNGGRICWAVAGSFCEENHGTFVKDKEDCFLCDFYRTVYAEEIMNVF